METGEGCPVVFQHGLCADAGQPVEIFPDMPGWRCITLECRGHGRSDAAEPADISIATFAEDVAKLIEERELGPVILGGISMGAAIALRLAVTRPALLRGLILGRPAWVTDSAPDNMRPNAIVGDLLREFPAEEARSRFEATALARNLAETGPGNLASLRGFFSREPLQATSALLCRISADGPGVTPAQIGAVHVPTLVVGHGRDVVHPFGHAQMLAALIPGARLVRITPPAEGRDAFRTDFRTAMADFLRRLSS